MDTLFSWSDFRREIETIYTPPGRAPNTYQKMSKTLRLAEQFGIESLAELTTAWAARFVAWRSERVGRNTIRGDLSYLAAAAQIAVDEGWMDKPPVWRRVRPRPGPASRKRLHSIDDVRRVLELLASRAEDWKQHRLLALVSTTACTGLRKQEVLRLRTEDVDLDRRLIAVVERGRRLKTIKSAGEVPICPELKEVLEGWLPRCGGSWVFPGSKGLGPWTGGTSGKCPTDRVRAVGLEAGVEGLTLASLRHTFATWARRRWGLSAIKLRDVLRHETEHTQEHYVHDEIDESIVVSSVDRVSYLARA